MPISIALYRYCYLVASVVGLVCIRIFGYSDPRAERTSRGDRHRLPTDQHPARRKGRRNEKPDLSADGPDAGLWD